MFVLFSPIQHVFEWCAEEKEELEHDWRCVICFETKMTTAILSLKLNFLRLKKKKRDISVTTQSKMMMMMILDYYWSTW